MTRLAPENYPPTITIVCTDKKQHAPRRLGDLGAAGGIWTVGGPKDRRQPSRRGRGPNTDPEPCPLCPRTARLKREDWQKIFLHFAALGEPQVDISFMP